MRPVPIEARGEMNPADHLDAMILQGMRQRSQAVAPGVLAHVIDRGKWLEVRSVMAATPRVPGAVGRWLDTLPADRKVVVSAVVSGRLASMLHRRGFTAECWWDTSLDMEDTGAMIRRPA
jgi:hypothetical protein